MVVILQRTREGVVNDYGDIFNLLMMLIFRNMYGVIIGYKKGCGYIVHTIYGAIYYLIHLMLLNHQ